MTTLATRIVRAIERALSIFCHLDGHTTDPYSGACMRCGAQIFTPLEETR